MKTSLPLEREITFAYIWSAVICATLALASVAGFVLGGRGLYSTSSSVLVSPGGDVANLILIVSILLYAMWMSRRGSLVGLLLWPGALFYCLYAYIPYLVGAPFTVLVFLYVLLVAGSGFTLIALLASIDGEAVRQHLATVPVRSMGIGVVVIAALAFAGLAVNALSALSNSGAELARGHFVADWAVGTPALLLGGVLAWKRTSSGYVVALGLLLVSTLGGVAFAVAAVIQNALGYLKTDPATIAVHLAISFVSIVLLGFFVVRANGASKAPC